MSTTQPICFDDVSTKQGICQDIDFICGTTLATFPKADKVRLVNIGLDSVADLIQKVSDSWSWEDTGKTDLPIATANVVANQVDYAIDTSFLTIRGVYIKNGSAYQELPPVDRKNILAANTALSATPATGYFLSGNSIFLDPIPSANITAGLKVIFERNVVYFASDATTATVGYNPQFTRLATLYACKDYAIAKGKENLNVILNEIGKIEARLQASYGRRNKAGAHKLVANIEDCH